MSEEVDERQGERTGRVIVVIILVLLLVIGGVAHLVGTGFLGYRVIFYGEGELYILNLSPEERFVSVDGREAVVVHARDAQLVEIIGGRSQVEILDSEQNLWRSFEVEIDDTHALLNISDDSCLAVTDISGLYKGGDPPVELRAMLGAEVEVYELGSKNVVWPRRTPPQRVDPSQGPALSVEIVGCSLFEEPGFLREYLLIRIEERMAQSQGSGPIGDYR